MLNIDALIGSSRYAGFRIKFIMLASELNLTWPVYIFITSYRDEELPLMPLKQKLSPCCHKDQHPSSMP